MTGLCPQDHAVDTEKWAGDADTGSAIISHGQASPKLSIVRAVAELSSTVGTTSENPNDLKDSNNPFDASTTPNSETSDKQISGDKMSDSMLVEYGSGSAYSDVSDVSDVQRPCSDGFLVAGIGSWMGKSSVLDEDSVLGQETRILCPEDNCTDQQLISFLEGCVVSSLSNFDSTGPAIHRRNGVDPQWESSSQSSDFGSDKEPCGQKPTLPSLNTGYGALLPLAEKESVLGVENQRGRTFSSRELNTVWMFGLVGAFALLIAGLLLAIHVI